MSGLRPSRPHRQNIPSAATPPLKVTDLGLAYLFAGYGVLLGIGLRLYFVLSSDFPLTDGGLFFAMIRDLQSSGYALPQYTSYNRADIPFAYPPLAFYLAGLLDSLTPIGLLDVFRFLPFLLNVLVIVAFYRFARTILQDRTAAAFALMAFPLLPTASLVFIMGGGITRSAGFAFATLMLREAFLLNVNGGRKRILTTSALGALTLLSHPQMTYFAALSGVLLFLVYGHSWRAFRGSALAFIGILAITAPWWLTVIGPHGIAPYMAATNISAPWYQGLVWLLTGSVTSERLFPALGLLAAIGALACIAKRELFLPVWLSMVFAMDPRSAHQGATVPLALLSGTAISEFILPSLTRRQAFALLTITICLGSASSYFEQRSDVSPLAPSERAAMQWISNNTPEGSTFLVIAPDNPGFEKSAEWFPVLANRVSVATAQGYEWVSGGGFARQVARTDTLRSCAAVECVEAAAASQGMHYTHVYISKALPGSKAGGRIAALRASLASDPSYPIIYDGPGAAVFVREEKTRP